MVSTFVFLENNDTTGYRQAVGTDLHKKMRTMEAAFLQVMNDFEQAWDDFPGSIAWVRNVRTDLIDLTKSILGSSEILRAIFGEHYTSEHVTFVQNVGGYYV